MRRFICDFFLKVNDREVNIGAHLLRGFQTSNKILKVYKNWVYNAKKILDNLSNF